MLVSGLRPVEEREARLSQDPANAPDERAVPDAATLMSVLDGLPVMVTATEGPELRLVAMSAVVQGLSGRPDWLGEPLSDVYPELVGQGMVGAIHDVYRTGRPVTMPEWRVELFDGPGGAVTEAFVNWTAVPWTRPDGSVRGVLNIAVDVTEQVLARRRAEEEAAQAGQRYRQALDVVGQLQQALLPVAVPVLPRLDVAARYLVAGAEQSAGGDWFDVRPLPGGRVGLVVGDVVGHGVAAAAVMSQLRAVLAHALERTGDPAAAVTELEEFTASLPGARSATVVAAVLDPAAGTLHYVTRGHPAPLLVSAGQGRQLLGSGGGPLGSGAGNPAQRTALRNGDVVVLFSDGLVERSDRPYTQGLDELSRVAEAATAGQLWPTGTSPSAVDRICTDAVEMLTRRGFDDDVTVLAVALRPAMPELRTQIRATADDLPRMREAVRKWLAALRIDPNDQLAVELAVGEAVDNAVEHGFGYLPTGTVVVALRLGEDGRVLVRVDDDGIWRAPDAGSGRGTGLALIGSLGEQLTVDGQPTGTTVTFSRTVTRPVTTTPAAGAAPAPMPPAGERFDTLVVGDPPVVRVRGPVDAVAADRFRQQLTDHARGGTVPLTVDLTAASHLTSVGVAVLADLVRDGERTGQPATLVAPTGSPAAFVLDLVGLPRRPTGTLPPASGGNRTT
jgi:serine phosphatase RsbU (regulator of sigma subunit)/anti-sigma regulatory factor (Ser/Thr protein kinase)/anti-anti-sigma regulatory factor